MKKIITIFITLILVFSFQALGKEIKFKGKTVTEKDSGLTVYGEKKAGIIAVTSYKYYYALILPFSKKWTFTPNDGILLKGNSDLINISLWSEIFEGTPDKYIIRHKEELSKSDKTPSLLEANIIKYEQGQQSSSILKTVLDLSKLDEKYSGYVQLNFFAAKNWESNMYCIHYSEIITLILHKGIKKA